MNDRGQVTSIIEDHVERLAIGKGSDGLLNAPVIFLLSLTLPREDGHTSCGDTAEVRVRGARSVPQEKNLRSRSVVLGREDVLKREQG